MVEHLFHNMFDNSTCFGPTGPSAGASINCVLQVCYVKTACCSVRPYVKNYLTYGHTGNTQSSRTKPAAHSL